MLIENTIFWDVTPCSKVEAYRRFGGTYHLHFWDWIIRNLNTLKDNSLLRNVHKLLSDHTASHPKRQYCTYPFTLKSHIIISYCILSYFCGKSVGYDKLLILWSIRNCPSWEGDNRSSGKYFPVFHGTRMCIIMLTSACQWILSWVGAV